MRRRRKLPGWVIVLIIVGWFGYQFFLGEDQAQTPASTTTNGNTSTAIAGGERAVLDAFADRRSEVVVEVAGTVDRTLSDDNEGSRHQRFILKLPAGHTVLVSHNIDLAQRVPLGRGDLVQLRGQYEWNEQGGVIHWTHHDPRGRRPGGWIRHNGQEYR